MAFDLKSWLFGGTTDPTQDWIEKYNNGSRDLNADRSNAFYDQLTGGGSMDPSSWYNKTAQMQSGQDDLLAALTKSANRSGADMFGEFSQFQPDMMKMAGNVADQSMQYQGQNMEDYARMRSRESMRNLENQFGNSGMFSTSNGAAAAAMARGAQDPIMQTMSNLGQMRSNNFMGAYNPMADRGYQSVLDRTANLGGALGGLNSSMQLNSGIGNNLAAYLSDQSQQALLAPKMQQNDGLIKSGFDALAGGLGKGLGNWMSGWKWPGTA